MMVAWIVVPQRVGGELLLLKVLQALLSLPLLLSIVQPWTMSAPAQKQHHQHLAFHHS